MIDTEQQLSAFLPAVRAAEWIAVDTEADSLHAYPEKICLIQISTAAGDELVDPLAPIDLDALLDALNAHVILMHGADYDLRLLQKHHEFTPAAIFDTMLAARLLGIRQFGLQSLVENFLGVKLDKGSQKANWARRPLTDRMVEYARNDTHYLKPLVDKLRAELEARGRLAWHEESCARLIADCTRLEAPDTDAIWRVKGSFGLSRRALAVLRALWHWRESEAVLSNKPPFFILSHEKLVELSDAAGVGRPVDPLVPNFLTPRRRDGLAQAVKNGLAVSDDKLPEILRNSTRRPNDAERRRFHEIEKRRDAHAHKLEIDPTLIAPRHVMGDLARDWDAHVMELMGWQRELLK